MLIKNKIFREEYSFPHLLGSDRRLVLRLELCERLWVLAKVRLRSDENDGHVLAEALEFGYPLGRIDESTRQVEEADDEEKRYLSFYVLEGGVTDSRKQHERDVSSAVLTSSNVVVILQKISRHPQKRCWKRSKKRAFIARRTYTSCPAVSHNPGLMI